MIIPLKGYRDNHRARYISRVLFLNLVCSGSHSACSMMMMQDLKLCPNNKHMCIFRVKKFIWSNRMTWRRNKFRKSMKIEYMRLYHTQHKQLVSSPQMPSKLLEKNVTPPNGSPGFGHCKHTFFPCAAKRNRSRPWKDNNIRPGSELSNWIITKAAGNGLHSQYIIIILLMIVELHSQNKCLHMQQTFVLLLHGTEGVLCLFYIKWYSKLYLKK